MCINEHYEMRGGGGHFLNIEPFQREKQELTIGVMYSKRGIVTCTHITRGVYS